jgi:NAD(P)H-dependent FMN reductase
VSKLKILVIIGSTREGRYGDKPAHWIRGRLAAHDDLDVELVDLRDYPLPFFDQAKAPARVTDGHYGNDVADRWAAKLAEADGYVVTAAEYNHGYTAVLKNALDWVFPELVHKPITFVGYGNAGGARAIEQLRQVAVEFQMAPTRFAVHVPVEVLIATRTLTAPIDPALFAPADNAAAAMIKELVWWARTLRAGRAAS